MINFLKKLEMEEIEGYLSIFYISILLGYKSYYGVL